MKHRSTKTYGHEQGFSCAFRQWRAESHCALLHGYSLAFRFEFEADELDARNWVMDFGGFKELRVLLTETFDHTTVIAEDDPELDWFNEAQRRGLLRLTVLPATGCESFAAHLYQLTARWLTVRGFAPRCRCVSVEVREHGANSAVFVGEG